MDSYLIIEVLAVGFSLLFLILVIRENIWCWPFGIISSGLSVVLFHQSKLYSEAVLYIFYVLMGFYGWYQWQKKARGNVSNVKEWSIKQHILIFLVGLFLLIGLGSYFSEKTDASLPYADAGTTAFSFVATFLEAHKILSTWIYWIVLNGFTIGLYWYKGLNIYAGLMVVYFVFSFVGWFSWKKRYEEVNSYTAQ